MERPGILWFSCFGDTEEIVIVKKFGVVLHQS